MDTEKTPNEVSGGNDGYPFSKRSMRRHHRKRLKRKRRVYWGGSNQDEAKVTGKKYAAPKPQSTCMCCMNRRAVDGPTRQERKVDIDEQVADIHAEDSFVCSRCGTFTWEFDRAGNADECVYCY